MATENDLAKVLRDYLAKAPIFAKDRAQAERDGFKVDDDISITLNNACGHPTGSLVRQYTKEGANWKPLRSTFDFTRRGREWGGEVLVRLPWP